MLIDPQRSALLLIDVQQKLVPAIAEAEQLLGNCEWLLDVARQLQIPLLASEQYPQGLGPTLEALRVRLPAAAIHSKQAFSCYADEGCRAAIDALGRDQIVIAGIESHVCVLQTALELQQAGLHPFVVEDCVSSRQLSDKQTALARFRHNGIQVVTREMVAFEWMRSSAHEQFREISKRFLR